MVLALSNNSERSIVVGKLRMFVCRMTFTGVTSGSVITDLKSILAVSATNLTDGSRAMVVNTTSTAGTVAISAVTAGDVVDVVAFGY